MRPADREQARPGGGTRATTGVRPARGAPRPQATAGTASLIALQRNVGNSALTRHLLQRRSTPDDGQVDDARPAGSPGLPVQRLYTADSHPGLARHYDEMMRSPAFQELDALVTAHRPVRLVAGRGSGGSHDYTEHAITLPVSAPAATLRRLLLVEMHNAGRGGAI